MASPLPFEKLFREENDLLSEPDRSGTKETLRGLETETPGPAGEPWIRYTSIDRVGLAFSGGGIRSATFNLGVLKALHDLRLLKHIDYLSTVSGGGYIGAWWSAWRARWGKEFPETPASSQVWTNVSQKEMNREPEEVRHLREFSNFLSPRIGFFESEMWGAIMAVLSAVLPAIIVASAVIALMFLGWLGATSVILADVFSLPIPGPPWLGARTVLIVLIIVSYVAFEDRWGRQGKAESLHWSWKAFHLLLITLITLGIYFGWRWLKASPLLDAIPNNSVHGCWEWATSIEPPQNNAFSFSPAFSPYLFAAPLLWAGVALLFLGPRLIMMRFFREQIGTLVSTLDRALSRLLAAALIFAALAALWLAGCWLNYTDWGANVPAGGALVSGGAFALLRNWMGRLGPGKKGGVMDIIKPMIPQILAYVAIGLWAVWIAALLAGWIQKGFSPWSLAGYSSAIVLFALVFFDAAQVSLHSFYRNRLSRAYLGASNLDARSATGVSAETNRQTDVRRHDDIELRALSPTGAELKADRDKPEEDRIYSALDTRGASRVRPLHLVCCAANDLGGDHLGNLSRGSRSAVLSKFGFAIGNYWKRWGEEKEEEKGENDGNKKEEKKKSGGKTLGLGSAITASAAAFNSNMGSLSMTLGAGVTFLCTALNLRLGLWLPHPLNAKNGPPAWIPGLLFFKEMFGDTKSGVRRCNTENPEPVALNVHLSDGAHFENLALYELVRRHCRYIIVSDCGADPEVTFEDFGNAVRRVREDFGVEIEIDLSPLIPNAARISKQHAAVGTISYDPRGDGKDNAILLYLKPALTGDEPCDITQYRTRNEEFPHESTGDQFYDEAQWESYRRLGEHATRSALRFVERMTKSDARSADEVFNGARWEWYQSPERREEKILELTSRLAAFERQLRQEAPPNLVREMYPELDHLGLKKSKTKEVSADETGRTLHFLTQMLQLMEDVWLAAYLETHWNDPNNLGWMNTFQRWAYTPSFRLWWPILKPMYGRKFRRFMEERLSLRDDDYPPTTDHVTNHGGELPAGVAQTYWNRMNAENPGKAKGQTVYSYDLQLTDQGQENRDRPVQVGLAFLDRSPDDPTVACWSVDEFFVPPSLWGAGLGAKFLHKLLGVLKAEGFKHCEVRLEPREQSEDVAFPWSKRTDVASRQQLNDLLAFYQRARFTLYHNRLVRDLKEIVPEPAKPHWWLCRRRKR